MEVRETKANKVFVGSSYDVTMAFCKRAAIAQQLV